MENFSKPRTYEEARRIGNYWDWNNILRGNLDDRERYIAIFLLQKEIPIDKVHEMVGLSAEERKLKNADRWKRVCAAVDDKSTTMGACFRTIIRERMGEITKKILMNRLGTNLEIDDICEVTGFPREHIKELFE